jgi:hypothetical protein
MTRRIGLRLAIATLIGGALGGFWVASAGASTSSPHITAHPDNVVVDTSTHLIGKNFDPSTTLTVEECLEKHWIAPQNPCDSTNAVVVTTNSRGEFKSSFIVETCSSGMGSSPGFAERCYIGVPIPNGVDTITLLGAARIVVTGP